MRLGRHPRGLSRKAIYQPMYDEIETVYLVNEAGVDLLITQTTFIPGCLYPTFLTITEIVPLIGDIPLSADEIERWGAIRLPSESDIHDTPLLDGVD